MCEYAHTVRPICVGSACACAGTLSMGFSKRRMMGIGTCGVVAERLLAQGEAPVDVEKRIKEAKVQMKTFRGHRSMFNHFLKNNNQDICYVRCDSVPCSTNAEQCAHLQCPALGGRQFMCLWAQSIWSICTPVHSEASRFAANR